jgi:hypothetical protein
MHLREIALAVSFAATGAVSTAADPGGSASAKTPTSRDVAVFDAPIGHRQPTLGDLPPWLRELEEAGPGQSTKPATGVQQRDQKPKQPRRDDSGHTPESNPYIGVPQICRPC